MLGGLCRFRFVCCWVCGGGYGVCGFVGCLLLRFLALGLRAG